MYPTDLKLISPDTLKITWSDDREFEYPVRLLRDRCPCASCRERRKSPPQETELLPVIRPDEAQPLRIDQMRPVGNYAYGIAFSDGHDTGIFTLEFLRELGEELSQAGDPPR